MDQQSYEIVKKDEKSLNDCINVLLLGESGVGKSTFINALFNYILFPSLDQAETSNDIKNPINAKFTYYDDNHKIKEIFLGDKNDQNEIFSDGQSSTQTARAYIVPSTNLQIIDTPGMGDTRGIEVDRKNFRQTVEYLTKFDYLDCICFLIKPNSARFGQGFKYCFKELFSNLSKSSTKNIVFCFTNTRSTMYRPGDTMEPLTNFINEINSTYKVDIPMSYDNMFCLDNEAFRYLMLVKNKIKLSSVERQQYAQSWKHSSTESRRLIEYIKTLERMKASDIVSLNNFKFTMIDWVKDAMECLLKLESEIIKIETALDQENILDETKEIFKNEATSHQKASQNKSNMKPYNKLNPPESTQNVNSKSELNAKSNTALVQSQMTQSSTKNKNKTNEPKKQTENSVKNNTKTVNQKGVKKDKDLKNKVLKSEIAGLDKNVQLTKIVSNTESFTLENQNVSTDKIKTQHLLSNTKEPTGINTNSKAIDTKMDDNDNQDTPRTTDLAHVTNKTNASKQNESLTNKKDEKLVNSVTISKKDKLNTKAGELNTIADKIVTNCAKLSKYIVENSVAIFNDNFEAYMIEVVQNEQKKEYVMKSESKLLLKFKTLQKEYCDKRAKISAPNHNELEEIRKNLKEYTDKVEKIINNF